MGIEKDYLMRQLLMLFDVLQKIVRYRRKGEKGKALEEIDFFYKTIQVEQNIGEMGIEELIEYLEKQKKLNNQQLEMVGFVLKEEGELASSDVRRTDYFKKAFFILQKVDRESISFSMDRQLKIAQLKEYLN